MTDIIGLGTIEQAEAKKMGERVSEGKRKAKALRDKRHLQYLKDKATAKIQGISWYQKMWPGIMGRYRHTRNEMKARFRKKLNKLAYLRWGIIEPRKGQGHFARIHSDWQIVMNLIAIGWNPTSGAIDESVPPGRWDLDEEDWEELWRGWTPELFAQYAIERASPDDHFSLDTITIVHKNQFTNNQ